MKPTANQIICGSNIDVVKPWPANCIDSIITDAPYELGFMSKNWDSSGITYSVPMWKQMLRITKPGGFLLCFGGNRTHHRLACAIEDAGWEIRDCMMYLYGSGFPKSHNISKALEKKGKNELAKLWEGMGTALKPAWEIIVVAMKPLDGTFAHNAEVHGVAGLNIDGGRIGYSENESAKPGRWPANLILDEEAGTMLDEQSGITLSKGGGGKKSPVWTPSTEKEKKKDYGEYTGYLDKGGASRFFYCAKTSRKERNIGMENCENKPRGPIGKDLDNTLKGPTNMLRKDKPTLSKNNHPTVKPLALMKYLCTLLKMPSAEQIILDPFLGSGTTGMACASLGIDFIGIEKELEYCKISAKRISAILGKPLSVTLPVTKNIEPSNKSPLSPRQRIINAAVAKVKNRK